MTVNVVTELSAGSVRDFMRSKLISKELESLSVEFFHVWTHRVEPNILYLVNNMTGTEQSIEFVLKDVGIDDLLLPFLESKLGSLGFSVEVCDDYNKSMVIKW